MAWTAPRTWVAGETVTSVMMNAHVRDNLIAISSIPAVWVTHSIAQSIPNAAFTALAFDSEAYDTDTIHDTVTNNPRLTCRTAGKYLIAGHFEFNGAPTLGRAGIRRNGTTYIGMSGGNFGTAPGAVNVSTMAALAANDYVELMAYQNTGVASNVNAVASYSPVFTMQRLSE